MRANVGGEIAWRNTIANHNEARLGVSGGVWPQRGGKVFKKGAWKPEEDTILLDYVTRHGEKNWNSINQNTALQRNGKSCRLRWVNHLRPNLKKGAFSHAEESQVIKLHSQLGNKWACIARKMPGRTDNEIKNYWNTRLKKCQRDGLPVYPLQIQQISEIPNYSSSSVHPCPNFNKPFVSVLKSPFRIKYDREEMGDLSAMNVKSDFKANSYLMDSNRGHSSSFDPMKSISDEFEEMMPSTDCDLTTPQSTTQLFDHSEWYGQIQKSFETTQLMVNHEGTVGSSHWNDMPSLHSN